MLDKTRTIKDFSSTNERKKRITATILIASVIIAAYLLTSCQAIESISSGDKDVAATVNETKIYKSDVKQRVDAIQKAQPDMFKGEAGEAKKQELEERIIDSLISEQLLIEEATKQGAKISENDIEKRAKEILSKIPEEARSQQGLTVDSLKDNLKRQVALDFLQKKLSKDIKVTEAETKAYYEKNKEQFQNETYENANGKIKQIIASQKAFQKIQTLLTKLKKDAKIQREQSANDNKQ